jgi:selenocysteine lyase/cysteine desulfurase
MKNFANIEYGNSEDVQLMEIDKPAPTGNKVSVRAFEKLEEGVRSALETYSNVHRGTGHFSMITTALFERAREILLEYLGLDKKKHLVVFCSAYSSEKLKTQLHFHDYQIVSSRDIGLPLGLRALAIKKSALPKGIPFQTGGSVAKMVSPNFVIWADAPQKFEAGTPCIINAIAFALGITLRHHYGTEYFKPQDDAILTAKEILYHDELSGYSGSQLLAELGKLLIGRDLLIPTGEGEKPYINFDNAASTPTFLPIWNVVEKTWRQSEKVHGDIIREVKRILTGFLGANQENYETIFTCNATEAINMAARFVQDEYRDSSDFVILNSLLEHNSNELPWRYISGASLIRISVDKEGFVNPYELELILKKYNQEGIYGKKRIRIVAISGASNVLGTYNDIQAISRIAHKYNARILVDGAQLVAHRTVKMDDWGIDYLALSGHKVYAPFGSGALLVRKELVQIGQVELERIMTSGEENIVGIAALGKAITLLQRIGLDVIEDKERTLVTRLLKGLSGVTEIEVYGIADTNSERLHLKGGIVSFRLKKFQHHLAAKELAERGGIGVRYGCFCTHLLIKHLLKLPPALAVVQNTALILVPRLGQIIPGLIRVSFGIENEVSEVDRFIEVLEKIIRAPHSITRNNPTSQFQTNVREKMEEFCETHIQKVYSMQ